MHGRCFDCLDLPIVFLHLKFKHYFISPCIRQACGLVSVLHEKSFPVFDTGGEVARSPGVLTPR